MLTNRDSAKFSVSRSTISCLLKEARDRNIVEIKIIEPWARVREIEYELKKQFSLQEVRVLARRNRDDTEVLQGLGLLTRELITSSYPLKPGMIVGVGAGRSVAKVVESLNPKCKIPITVIPCLDHCMTLPHSLMPQTWLAS
ncbi:MAG: sugar-binding domain-containing protein [Anaerolineaceae bacterium]